MTGLPDRAEVVVIGGGIMGCSTAYHLARDQKADVLLLEQGTLTSGTTWHAAGLVGQLRSSASITKLLKYSVELYRRLESETGLASGWRMTGCLRLAAHPDRWVEFKRLATTARSFGMEMTLLAPEEVKRMAPFLDVSDLIGATWLPTDGQASPSDIAQALAKGARMAGARIAEGVAVTGFHRAAGRITHVETTKGVIACDSVVNAAGQWARRVGAMAGVSVPLQPVRHQYVITEPMGLPAETPTIRDPDRRTYFKEEVGGLSFGGYEPDPILCPQDDPPGDRPFHLFEDDWGHFEQHMTAALARVPALGEIGVKKMINGAESFTPDGDFILGRAPECANMFVGAGFNAYGIAAAGGAGWALADWVARGEAPMDLWPVDILRFSALHRDRGWTARRTAEAYDRHYAIGYPHGEYASARGALKSPLYDRLADAGAVFGAKLGWERANWFAKSPGARDEPAMSGWSWAGSVAAEHRAVRERAGLFDQSSFAKFEVTGAGAATALERIAANRVARAPGRLAYTQMLNERGGVEADVTVARLDEDRFYIVTGTGFRTHDFAWIERRLAGDAVIRDVTEDWGVLTLAGPASRAILSVAAEADLGPAAFPFGHVKPIRIGGRALRALRVSYSGELGWELHVPIADLVSVYDALTHAGEGHGMALCGYRAIESLRLEKAYRAWGADLTPGDTPFEAGLGWAVKMGANVDFIGRAALEAAKQRPLAKRLMTFALDDDAALLGRETILRDGAFAGYLSSGGYGWTMGGPIGLGYLRREEGVTDEWIAAGRYELVVAGRRHAARVCDGALYDPAGDQLRS